MLYPKAGVASAIAGQPDTLDKIWNCLNSISIDNLVEGGRVYGGGLHKVEPKELAKIPLVGLDFA